MSNIDTIRGLESVHKIKAIESTYDGNSTFEELLKKD